MFLGEVALFALQIRALCRAICVANTRWHGGAQYPLGSPTPAAAAIPARVRCAHKTQLSSGSRFLIQKILNQKLSSCRYQRHEPNLWELDCVCRFESSRVCAHRLRMI